MFYGFYNGYSKCERSKKASWCRQFYPARQSYLADKCELCASTKTDLELHSEDYSWPYIPNQYRLCRTCHRQRLHTRFSDPGAWATFKAVRLRKWRGPKPWWDVLSTNPRMRWMFDARPRAVFDLLDALHVCVPRCNGFQTRVLSALASLEDREWTLPILASRMGGFDLQLIRRHLQIIGMSIAAKLGYEPPMTGAGRPLAVLVLASPEYVTTALPYRFSPDHTWRTNRAFIEAFRLHKHVRQRITHGTP